MGLLSSLKKRLLIPGEEITLLGFDFNAQTVRIFDGFMRYSNSMFKNRFKEEGIDGRTAQPFQLMNRVEFDPYWLTLEDIEDDGSYLIRVNPKYAPILDTGEAPAGLIFIVDYQAATGVYFETKGNPDHPEGKPPRGFIPEYMTLDADTIVNWMVRLRNVYDEIKKSEEIPEEKKADEVKKESTDIDPLNLHLGEDD